jgi:O-antigen ligase
VKEMKNPLSVMTLLIVLCMAVDYRFQSGVEGLPSITIVEGLCYLAVLFLFVRLAGEGGDELSRRIIAVHRKNRLVAWYFIWTGLASVASLVRSSDALRFYKDLLPSLVVYVLISVCIVNTRGMKAVIVAFLSGRVLILEVGLSQTLTGIPRVADLGGTAAFKTDFWGNSAGVNLSTGFFLHPNGYAIFLLPVATLLIGLLLKKDAGRPIRKVLLVLMLLLTAYNLAGTYAKGVIVWVAVGIGLLLLVTRLRRSSTIAAVVILISSIAVITMYGIGALGAIGQPYGTMITRLQLWKAGIDLIGSDMFVLFLGNGFSAMMTSSELYSSFAYPNAHNTYINQVIYFGVPALFLYVGLAAQALRRISRIMHDHNRNGYQGIAARVLFATITALLGIYFFEPANEGVILQLQFFAVLAFANAIGTEPVGNELTGKIESRER